MTAKNFLKNNKLKSGMLFGIGENHNLLSFRLNMTMYFHEVKRETFKVVFAKYIILKLNLQASDMLHTLSSCH